MKYVSLALVAAAAALPASAQRVVLDNGSLTLGSGTLIARDTFDVRANGSLNEVGGRLLTPASTAPVTLNAPTSVDVGGLGFVITSAQNPGVTTVRRTLQVQTAFGNTSIARTYRVTAETDTGLNATIVFRYDDADLNGLTEGTLSLFRSEDDGATWQEVGGAVDAAANTITATGVDGFSLWTAAASGALPVELASFSAQSDGPRVVLTWTTASETNNAGWAVQASASDALAWQALGFVPGAGTTAERHAYAHTATGLAPGRYRFRLLQTDTDGAQHAGPVVEAVVGLDGPFALAVGPSPARTQAHLALTVERPQNTRIALFDGLGREVLRVFDGAMEAGQAQRFVLDVAALPAGRYLVRVEGETFRITRPLVVAR